MAWCAPPLDGISISVVAPAREYLRAEESGASPTHRRVSLSSLRLSAHPPRLLAFVLPAAILLPGILPEPARCPSTTSTWP